MSENHDMSSTIKDLPLWRGITGRPAIHRKFRFKDFSTAWGFLSQVALLAAMRNQYPELINNGERITVIIHKNDSDKAEEANIQMAMAIDAILPPPPAPVRKVKARSRS